MNGKSLEPGLLTHNEKLMVGQKDKSLSGKECKEVPPGWKTTREILLDPRFAGLVSESSLNTFRKSIHPDNHNGGTQMLFEKFPLPDTMGRKSMQYAYSPEFIALLEKKIKANNNPPPIGRQSLGERYPNLPKIPSGAYRLSEPIKQILQKLKRRLSAECALYGRGIIGPEFFFSADFFKQFEASLTPEQKKELQGDLHTSTSVPDSTSEANQAMNIDTSVREATEPLRVDPAFVDKHHITSYGSFFNIVRETRQWSRESEERAQQVYNLIMCADDIQKCLLLCTFFKEDMEETKTLSDALIDMISPLSSEMNSEDKYKLYARAPMPVQNWMRKTRLVIPE